MLRVHVKVHLTQNTQRGIYTCRLARVYACMYTYMPFAFFQTYTCMQISFHTGRYSSMQVYECQPSDIFENMRMHACWQINTHTRTCVDIHAHNILLQIPTGTHPLSCHCVASVCFFLISSCSFVAIDRVSVYPCHGLSSDRSICLSAALHHVCVCMW